MLVVQLKTRDINALVPQFIFQCPVKPILTELGLTKTVDTEMISHMIGYANEVCSVKYSESII